MGFSKFDPHRPTEGQALDATDPSAERRARFLKWANWIVLGFTMFGFGVLAWVLLKR
ncbi:MAG: hypothetical protein QOC71_632 [Thermoplasmata archaeon]|nr:hypothetical protein [Thermoplasmata archaeon]